MRLEEYVYNQNTVIFNYITNIVLDIIAGNYYYMESGTNYGETNNYIPVSLYIPSKWDLETDTWGIISRYLS